MLYFAGHDILQLVAGVHFDVLALGRWGGRSCGMFVADAQIGTYAELLTAYSLAVRYFLLCINSLIYASSNIASSYRDDIVG